ILNRAWPGDDGEFAAADWRVAHADDRLVGSQIERDQLVRLGDADDFRDPGQIFKTPAINRTFVASDTNGGTRGSGHRMRAETDCLNNFNHRIDLRCRGAGFHHNQHMVISSWICFAGRRDRSPARDDSASVGETVASYRQIPSADVEADRKLFAASAEQNVSVLIAHEYSGNAMIVDTNISPLGNSNVTEMRKSADS